MQPLPTLATPFRLSKPTAKLQRELNERIAAFNTRRDEHFSSLSAFQAAQLDEAFVETIAEQSDGLQRGTLSLLVAELKLREELNQYFRAAQIDREQALDRANNAHQAVTEEVTAKLVELGYPLVDHGNGPRIHPPLIVMSHPRVKQAALDVSALQSIRDDDIRENGLRVGTLVGELAALRSRVAALATR